MEVHADGQSVTLSAKRPIKGIILDVDGDADATWSDQAIDLVARLEALDDLSPFHAILGPAR